MATQADLVRDAQRTQSVIKTLVGSRGTIDFIDDEWAGANNYNPASLSVGPVMFDQPSLDALFGPGVFSVAEWLSIQSAIGTIKSAIGANAQIMDRLADATING